MKILLITFVRRVYRCCVQSFMLTCENAWEEFEKDTFREFAGKKKNGGENGSGLYHEIRHNSLNAQIQCF